jgi:N-acetylmuramoyl-L-alanine amidase
MAAVPPPRPSSKHDILRAVYEDNLRVADPAPTPRTRRKRPEAPVAERAPSHRGLTLLGVLLVAAIVAVGVLPGLRADAPAPPPADRRANAGPPLGLTASPDLLNARFSIENPESVSMAELFNLQVNTIVLDPGHGGRDPGTVGATGMTEKDITLDVALRLRRRLEQRAGYRILMTRETDEAVALGDRVAFANERDADLFVSLHVNWIPDASVAPLETYYFGLQTDDETLQLAHGENAAADYSVAEFNTMLQRAGNTVKFQESKELAETVQHSLVRNVRETNAEASDWGVKAGPFVVLLGVEAPAILAEMAAISNPDEEARLATEAHREALAASLEEGVIAYLQQRLLTSTANTSTRTAIPHGQEEN